MPFYEVNIVCADVQNHRIVRCPDVHRHHVDPNRKD